MGEDDRKDITDRINNKFYINDLNHPNIIKFKEWWFDALNFYFLAEFIEGKELLDYAINMNYTEKNIIDIVKKLISASIYILNTAEFQFTDLKPHSIFVIEKGNSISKNSIKPKICVNMLNISKFYLFYNILIDLKVTDFDYKWTFEGTKCPKIRYGSIYFVSPEVIEQTHNDEWLVWNVGAILYLLLSGKQIVEEYGFKKYQDKLKENSQVNFELSEFKSINRKNLFKILLAPLTVDNPLL